MNCTFFWQVRCTYVLYKTENVDMREETSDQYHGFTSKINPVCCSLLAVKILTNVLVAKKSMPHYL